jgi:hypothetical protein
MRHSCILSLTVALMLLYAPLVTGQDNRDDMILDFKQVGITRSDEGEVHKTTLVAATTGTTTSPTTTLTNPPIVTTTTKVVGQVVEPVETVKSPAK